MNSAGNTWSPSRGAIKGDTRHGCTPLRGPASLLQADDPLGYRIRKAGLQTQKGHLVESNCQCNSEQPCPTLVRGTQHTSSEVKSW